MSAFEFDQLYVISDIHLGGREGFQIFNQSRALSWLIRYLKDLDADQRIGLVLNGDIVDFLAEKPSQYLDHENAVDKLNRIIEDPTFAEIWVALREYVKSAGRELIVVLGNHDVELALPAVHESLRTRLCGKDVAARGRFHFVVDGNGYVCKVGSASVLCLHGNEVDNWNLVDFRTLAELIKALNRKGRPHEWVPNAGTKMVIDVMNDIKERRHWIDLLKPEDKSLIALLVSIEPSCLSKLRKLPGIASRGITDSLKKAMGFLSEEEIAEQEREDYQAFDELLLECFDVHAAGDHLSSDVEQLVRRAEKAVIEDKDPMELADESMLGVDGAILDLIRGRSAEENMREALRKWGRPDRTFNPNYRDRAFEKIDDLVGPGVDFVIAGHTHLHRCLKREKGPGFYYNTGTWIRLMEITDDVLEDKKRFSILWNILQDGSLNAIDNPSRFGADFEIVRPIRTVASICKDKDGSVKGCLHTVEENGAEVFELQRVPGSEFQR